MFMIEWIKSLFLEQKRDFERFTYPLEIESPNGKRKSSIETDVFYDHNSGELFRRKTMPKTSGYVKIQKGSDLYKKIINYIREDE